MSTEKAVSPLLEEKPRIYKWDNIKFLLILLVVVSHFAQHLDDTYKGRFVFYSTFLFHMPAFVFVSGLFSKSFVRKDKLDTQKIFAFVALYVAFKMSISFLRMATLGRNFRFNLFSEEGAPWYMLCMAIWYVGTYLLKNVKPIYLMIFSVLLACAVGYDKNVDNFLCMNRAIIFYPFFLMGYYCDADKIMEYLEKRWVKIVSAVFLVVTFTLIYIYVDEIYWTFFLFNPKDNFYKLPNPEWGYWLRLVYYVVTSVISFAFMSLVPKSKTFFSKLGQRTLQIYFYHRLVVYFIFDTDINNWIDRTYPKIAGEIYMVMAVVITFVLGIGFLGKPFDMLLKNADIKLFKKKDSSEEKI